MEKYNVETGQPAMQWTSCDTEEQTSRAAETAMKEPASKKYNMNLILILLYLTFRWN